MKKLKIVLIGLVLVFIFGCNKEKWILEIEYDKALIPEGIVVDKLNNKLYLSSIHKKKITETDLGNGETKDLIDTQEYGFKLGVGLELKEDKLFALSGEEQDGKSTSSLLVIDLKNGNKINKYELKDTLSHFMNDLAISEGNDIYITDTKRNCVYRLGYPNGEIEMFMDDAQITHPNGIAISDDNKLLYVDSWFEGVRVIDIFKKEILNLKNELTSEIGIDGMKYYNGNLYAIRNGGEDGSKHGLIRINLSADGKEIEGVESLLINDSLMNVPTTLDVVDGIIYILGNSQMNNLNQETNEIIDKDSLTNTYILKYEINGGD